MKVSRKGKTFSGHLLQYLFNFVALDSWDMQVVDRPAQHEAMQPGAICWGKVCTEPEELTGYTFLLEASSPRASVVFLNHTITVTQIIFKNQNEKEKGGWSTRCVEQVYNQNMGPVGALHSMATDIPLNHNLKGTLHYSQGESQKTWLRLCK